LPPSILLVAEAVAQVRRKVLFVAALMILLGLSLNGTYAYLRGRVDAEHTDNWRDATHYVLTHADVGDAVLFSYSEERLAFDEYQRVFQMRGSPIHKFPDSTDLDLLTQRPSPPSPESLDRIVTGYRGVWLVSAFQPNRASREVEAVLSAHFSEHENRSF